MRITVLGERGSGDRRVAVTPEAVETLVAEGHQVVVESGAGDGIGAADGAYRSAGAETAAGPDLLEEGGLVVGIDPLTSVGDRGFSSDHVVVGLLDPVFLRRPSSGGAFRERTACPPWPRQCGTGRLISQQSR